MSPPRRGASAGESAGRSGHKRKYSGTDPLVVGMRTGSGEIVGCEYRVDGGGLMEDEAVEEQRG
jgi:hypothetical protein